MNDDIRIPRRYRTIVIASQAKRGKTKLARRLTASDHWKGDLPLIIEDPIFHAETNSLKDLHDELEWLRSFSRDGRIMLTTTTHPNGLPVHQTFLGCVCDLLIVFSEGAGGWIVAKDRAGKFPAVPGVALRRRAREAR